MIVRMQPDPDLTRFLTEIARLPALPRDLETKLVLLAQRGSKEAARKVCAHNLKFVVIVAKRYRGLGIPFQDLISEGSIGLTNAIGRFDPSTGRRLLTYAVWWIRQAITLAIQKKSKTVRTSAEYEPSLRRLWKSPLHQVIGGMYIEDLEGESERTGIRADLMFATLNASRGGLSLDQPDPGDGTSTTETAPSQTPQPDQLTEHREKVDILKRLRGKLNRQQREVITRCFGLDGGVPMTLEDVAFRMNVSRQRIDQIKREAILKMRSLAGPYAGL